MSDVSEGAALVAQWRTDAESDNPAGPLFIGGEYVESDIIGEVAPAITGCSLCTGSIRINCCA
jgi:hypothetical protein